jgi:hypothetical protein
MATVSHALNNQTGPEIGFQPGACVVLTRGNIQTQEAVSTGQAASKVDFLPQVASYGKLYIEDRAYQNIVVFWDVTLCGSCKDRRFGGT